MLLHKNRLTKQNDDPHFVIEAFKIFLNLILDKQSILFLKIDTFLVLRHQFFHINKNADDLKAANNKEQPYNGAEGLRSTVHNIWSLLTRYLNIRIDTETLQHLNFTPDKKVELIKILSSYKFTRNLFISGPQDNMTEDQVR